MLMSQPRFSTIRRSFYLLALIGAGGLVAADIAVANVRSATAGAPAPRPRATTITGATPGPLLIVTNNGTTNATAIAGVVKGGTAGIYSTAISGSVTATTGSGDGVYGATKTASGAGVVGHGVSEGVSGSATAKAGDGVVGLESGASGTGVYGSETYPAVKPPSTFATFPPGAETTGVGGSSSDGNGVVGVTTYPYFNLSLPSGVFGMDNATAPTANNGVFGLTTNGNAGVYGVGLGTGADNPDVGPSTGVVGEGPVGVAGATTSAAGAGPFAPGAFTAFPNPPTKTDTALDFVGYDGSGNTIFSVDNAGNVAYHGTLKALSKISAGMDTETYVPRVARPELEDVGQGTLRDGATYVALDPAFAASMEATLPYMVFVTPGGEANQLFVTQKSARGFWVRETRGHSSIPFDFRVVAYPKGEAPDRMRLRPETLAAPGNRLLQRKIELLSAMLHRAGGGRRF